MARLRNINPGSSTIDGSFYKMDDLFSKDLIILIATN